MGVKGARWIEPNTVDYLRPGEWLCFGCTVKDCDEKAEGCRWRQYKQAEAAIGQWWEATESPTERETLRVVGINLADASTEAVLEMLDSL